LSFLQLARGPCESPGVCVQATDRSALRGVSASEVRSSGHRRLGRVAGADPLLGFHPSRAVSSPVVTRPMSRLLSCTSVLGCHQPATCAPEFQRTGKLAGLSRDCRPSWVFRPRPSGARRHHRVSATLNQFTTLVNYWFPGTRPFNQFTVYNTTKINRLSNENVFSAIFSLLRRLRTPRYALVVFCVC
jgi:hypothetical protein